ncbi:helix-turn-helix domain-containing protein [Dictyobacter kobayashii]|uniref:HTH cro/C1-type domain-containing protein n=1 Tax=Dictyobacter kobayashii TaxID=2014872 RepID=A0A402AVV9_9CHLR|nr:helix-turn-helix domain-containing protein [Dictyobacter kobayashii]GCE23262.1 hypothetical protein KDK_70620 [Dictyobacter kobayashii]
MNDGKNINEALRRSRVEHGWTQKDLADALGVAEATVRSWEHRKRSPGPDLLVRLSRVLKKSPEELGLYPFPQTTAEIDTSPNDDDTSSFSDIEIVTEAEHHPFIHRAPFMVFQHSDTDENRYRMLKRVQTRWITGVLDHIASHSLISLDLQIRSDAVAKLWNTDILEDHPAPPEVTSKCIAEVYDEADRELLILGEPGSGKTTLLLELTSDLIKCAQVDEKQPIPVIFHLSSWANKQLPLDQWLEEELNTKYLVPIRLAKKWISGDKVVTLLDGLDEVNEEVRANCIAAINAYREDHGFVSMVVCCRSTVYASLPSQLVLNTAVEVQPLTIQKIDDYVARGGPSLAAMRQALQTDPALQEMASTPFMLNVLATVHQDLTDEEVQTMANMEERRNKIFETYVKRLLQRQASPLYTQEQIQRWLSWLAQQMATRNQTEFYLEHIQPDWLKEPTSIKYRNAVIRVIFGVNLALDGGLFACFRGDSEPGQLGLFYWLGGKGLGNTILGWMAQGIGGGLHGGTSMGLILYVVEAIVVLIAGKKAVSSLSLTSLRQGLMSGLRSALIFGSVVAVFAALVFGLANGWYFGIYHGLAIGLFEGILVGSVVGLLAALRSEQEDIYEQHQKDQSRWTRWKQRILKEKRSPMDRIINFALFTVCETIGMATIYSLQAGAITQHILTDAFVVGVGSGLIFGLGTGTDLLPGLGRIIEPTESVVWSWSTMIKNSGAILKKGILLALAIALPIIITLGAVSSFFNGVSYGWRYGIIYGAIVGAVNGLASILVGILNSGWSSERLSDDQRQSITQPNIGIRNSIKHGLLAAGSMGPVGGILGGVCCGLFFWLAGVPGWRTLLLGFILVYSVLFGFRFWIAYGGRAFIEHIILRWYLRRTGVIPKKYTLFLNYAAERALLRKVGGGYMFSHRLLLEYFARLSDHTHQSTTGEK